MQHGAGLQYIRAVRMYAHMAQWVQFARPPSHLVVQTHVPDKAGQPHSQGLPAMRDSGAQQKQASIAEEEEQRASGGFDYADGKAVPSLRGLYPGAEVCGHAGAAVAYR